MLSRLFCQDLKVSQCILLPLILKWHMLYWSTYPKTLKYVQEILVDRAVHAAVSRFLPSKVDKDTELVLQKEDFSQAMHEFVPIAMRGLTKAASEGGHSGWDDVGGLAEIRNAIQEVCLVLFFILFLDFHYRVGI